MGFSSKLSQNSFSVEWLGGIILSAIKHTKDRSVITRPELPSTQVCSHHTPKQGKVTIGPSRECLLIQYFVIR